MATPALLHFLTIASFAVISGRSAVSPVYTLNDDALAPVIFKDDIADFATSILNAVTLLFDALAFFASISYVESSDAVLRNS